MKKEAGDRLEEISRLLNLMQSYWTSMTIHPTMAEDWTFALLPYSKREIWKALEEFKNDINREFAPPISKLIGTMDANREIERKAQLDQLALEAPAKYKNDEESLELYSYTTTRTSPKLKKDDSETETRKALRVSSSRQKELADQKIRAGLVKKQIKLHNGKNGYEWGRP